MGLNEAGSHTRLHAYVSYRDADAGLAWLASVGFECVARQDAEDGSVLHAVVRLGDAVVMVATADAAYSRPALHGVSRGSGLYLWFSAAPPVDDWYARAVAAGATGVIAPEDTAWGSRRARVLDPEGYEWSAGTYGPG
ncbi:VOC family protein [Streptomyces sp. NPDC056524]|uniref:VOC family protein n=1 Tax=Streptomyces sp. NPDC056524 TaxID=3345851 RepID=UPI0036797169